MDIEKYLIPKRLDDKAQFFMWEADSAILFIGSIIVCSLLFNLWGFLIGSVLGYQLTKGLAQLKEMGGKQVIMGVVYWYTPSDWWPIFNKSAKSYVREYTS